MWKFIHLFINLWDPAQIAYLRWSPQHEKVQERLFYRQSASCAASRLSLQSVVMEWWMLWRADRLFFPPLLPCRHAPWLVLIIPWTLLFLVSSQVVLLMHKMPFSECLIPTSDISTAKKTGDRSRMRQKACVWLHLVWLLTLQIHRDLTYVLSIQSVL